MHLGLEIIHDFDSMGRSLKRQELISRCDECGVVFRRRRVIRDINRDYHYDKPECRYAAMKKGKKQDKVLRNSRIKKYGTEHHWQTADVKQKRVETWKAIYGVSNPAKSLAVQDRIKQTCLTRYKGLSGFQSPKTQETCLKRYGTISGFGGHFKTGVFVSKKAGIISYRSSYELKAFELLEANDAVIVFSVEALSIPYEYNGRILNYFPDILVEYSDGLRVIIEVKPIRLIDYSANAAKRLALIEFCRKENIKYELWTEEQLFRSC